MDEIKLVEYKVTLLTDPLKELVIEGKINPKSALKEAVSRKVIYEVENTKSGKKWRYSFICFYPQDINLID